MHYSDAEKIAHLGVNFLIGKDSTLHYSDAIKIIQITLQNGGHVTIEKDYHSSDIEKIAKIGGKNITIKI